MVLERIKKLDWPLLGALSFFALASLLTLASSSPSFFWRQFIWYGIAAVIILFGSQIDWRRLTSARWFRYGLYAVSIGLLILAYIQPHRIRGTKSWIFIGPFQFEPEELVKLSLIILFAYFFSRRHIAAWQAKNIFLSLFYAGIPTILIVLQPNFGSAVLVASIWVGFIFISGIHLKRFFIGLFLCAILLFLLWTFVFQEYQKERIAGFLSPEKDPLGLNYNVIQSKIAIGSAGFFGKGFGMGTQTRLGFLPAAQNDFLFAAFVEEWGILGGFLFILAFIFLMYRIFQIGIRARDNYGRLIALGTGVFFFAHFCVNIGANIGFLPVTGVTIPFFSYGGSNLLTTGVLLSILEHIKLESSA